MVKKTYIQPEMTQVTVEMNSNLLVDSIDSISFRVGESVDAGDAEVKDFDDGFWDDEW